MKIACLTILFLLGGFFVNAQQMGSSPEYVKELTSGWKEDCFNDGRPNVLDLVLERLEYCTLEQIWAI